MLHGQFIHHKPLRATEGKQVVVADGARTLIVPERTPVDRPAILAQSEFERLKSQAHVTTLEDRLKTIEELDRRKNALVMESLARKEELLKTQKHRIVEPGGKAETVESDSVHILKRSEELLMEQDERVKRANGIILAAKCRAIRNAQIAEKKVIERRLKEEETRLEAMMEQQRQKSIEAEEKKREEEEKKKEAYVVEVTRQMKENELERMLEAERIEEESRMLNKALIELQKDDEEKLRVKREEQLRTREELRRTNEEAEKYRNLKAEEQRIADLRVQEFMRQKAQREEAREKEQSLLRAAKEREIARLRAMQEKSRDIQAALDEMHALRTQEEKEREWREKEKRAALEKQKATRELHEARRRQVEDIRRAQALALARDEEDFKKVAKVQREWLERDGQKRELRKREVAVHRRELLKQIDEKEKERIERERERFEEGKAQRMEYALRDRGVEDYLKRKVERLRECNVPELYVRDIERQLKLGGK
ncbi:cilia- and flagella-associated protein 45-like isoform X2 [Cylas formicarius]|nr:cilia- and flagella-associated protein 45-like isoform X2 [Cylas formicarius]XP_060536758.1 cilia- and flagella-associated protein 45-like isoform X2 [Cylas formicarius]